MSTHIFGNIKDWDKAQDAQGGSLNTSTDGLFTRSRTILVRTNNPENYITYKEEHPQNEDFLMTAAHAEEMPGNVWKITLTYTGATAQVETYSYSTDTASNPIQAHPHYPELRTYANEDATTGEFLNFSKDKGAEDADLLGVTSYLDPRMSYTRTITMKNATGVLAGSQADYFNLARIFTDPPGPNPTIGAEYNWLLVRAAIEIIGGALRIQQTFQLSGENGWNPNIYESA